MAIRPSILFNQMIGNIHPCARPVSTGPLYRNMIYPFLLFTKFSATEKMLLRSTVDDLEHKVNHLDVDHRFAQRLLHDV